MNRDDLEAASKLIKDEFQRFGLTVHRGDKRSNETSKTEAMFFPAAGYTPKTVPTADRKRKARFDHSKTELLEKVEARNRAMVEF